MGVPMPTHKVLSLSSDQVSADDRRFALEQGGYVVTSCLKLDDARKLLTSEPFDALIIGHRFSAADKIALANEAKSKGVPVVLVSGFSSDANVPADARALTIDGADAVVKAVGGLIERRKTSGRTAA